MTPCQGALPLKAPSKLHPGTQLAVFPGLVQPSQLDGSRSWIFLPPHLCLLLFLTSEMLCSLRAFADPSLANFAAQAQCLLL